MRGKHFLIFIASLLFEIIITTNPTFAIQEINEEILNSLLDETEERAIKPLENIEETSEEFTTLPTTTNEKKSIEEKINKEATTLFTVGGIYTTAGSIVNLPSELDADIFAAGEQITTTGKITGDLHAAGNSIIIDSPVTGDLRVTGNTIIIKAPINGNLFAFGNTITIEKKGMIAGHATIYGTQVKIDGTIEKTTKIAAELIEINGIINGDSTIEANAITLSDTATLNNTVTTASVETPTISKNATLSDDYTHEVLGKNKNTQSFQWKNSNNNSFFLSRIFGGFIFIMIIGLIIVFTEPTWLQNIAKISTEKIAGSWLRGFIYISLLPTTLLLLFITIIGIPFAFFGTVLFTLTLMLGRIPIGLALGQKIWKYNTKKPKKKDIALRLGLGYALLTILFAIPFFGWLFGLLTGIWGSGAMIQEYQLTHNKK